MPVPGLESTGVFGATPKFTGGFCLAKQGLCSLFLRYSLNSGLPTWASVPLGVTSLGAAGFFLAGSFSKESARE